jgi:hypothetical protein
VAITMGAEQPSDDLPYVLESGTIAVVGTGGTREMFAHVFSPLQFRRAVPEQGYEQHRAQAA